MREPPGQSLASVSRTNFQRRCDIRTGKLLKVLTFSLVSWMAISLMNDDEGKTFFGCLPTCHGFTIPKKMHKHHSYYRNPLYVISNDNNDRNHNSNELDLSQESQQTITRTNRQKFDDDDDISSLLLMPWMIEAFHKEEGTDVAGKISNDKQDIDGNDDGENYDGTTKGINKVPPMDVLLQRGMDTIEDIVIHLKRIPYEKHLLSSSQELKRKTVVILGSGWSAHALMSFQELEGPPGLRALRV